jgi:hypothetical protein
MTLLFPRLIVRQLLVRQAGQAKSGVADADPLMFVPTKLLER